MSKLRTTLITTIFLTVIAVNVMAISFDPKVDYPAGTQPVSVFSADFDGDGYMDVACANISGHNISVMLNDGYGDFSAKVNYPTGGSNPYSVFAVDLFGDGDYDLLVANEGSDDVGLLMNNGDGTFATAVNFTSIPTPTAVCAADLDNNGFADIIIGAGGDADDVCIILNYGSGAFGIPTYYDAANGIYSVCTGDFDNDGDIDVASANFLGGVNDVSVFINNGDGTFVAAVHYSASSYAKYISSGDIDGDGYPDLAVANLSTNNVSVLMNNGDGTFGTATNYDAGGESSCIFISDIDGDNKADLIYTTDNNNVVTLMNLGGGSWGYHSHTTGSSPQSVFCADFDNDDDIDLVVGNNQTHNVSILMNQATFIESTYPPQNAINSPQEVYFHLYSLPDLPFDPSSINSSSIFINGSQSGLHTYYTNIGIPNHVVFFPYGDFLPGEVVSVTITDEIQPLGGKKRSENGFLNPGVLQFTVEATGDGRGNFSIPNNEAVGNTPTSIYPADLDGDGDLDLMIANYLGNNVSILKNNGDGTFTAALNYAVGNRPRSVYSADLDGDGDLDLMTANSSGANVSVLKNNGDGTFTAALNYAVGNSPTSIYPADLDGDGDLDLMTANSGGYNVSILFNNPPPWICGDVDESGDIGILDVVYIINYKYKDGPPPLCTPVNSCADVDNNGDIGILDVVYLINFKYKGGPPPNCP